MKYLFKILLFTTVLLALSCQKEEEDNLPSNSLEIVNTYTLNVKEPSGLAYDNIKQVLYTVSDNTNKIYKLSKTGNIFQEYNYSGDDLEGITINSNGNLIIVEERKREIIKYNLDTDETISHNIDIEIIDNNSGLEGVCYNSLDDSYFVLNEKDPGLLIILDKYFQKQEEYKLDFANDYSGICYDTKSDAIWIVSDQSKTLTKCSKTGQKIKQYNINIDKTEGIALDEENNIFYLVSDSKNTLYSIKYPN